MQKVGRVTIIEVRSFWDYRKFLNFPAQIYQDKYPRYVHPLRAQVKMLIGKIGSPRKHLFLAKNGNEVVARLAVKVHRHHNKETLNFGFFECKEGYPQAAKMLIEKAHSLYPHLKLMGPFHFRMEDPYIGILVDGFELDPYFLMTYNPPYYDSYLQQAGLNKSMDLYTYELIRQVGLNPVMYENAKRARDNGYTVRHVNPKKLKDEARSIARIFNDALSQNWGFEEFLDNQVKEMVMMLKLFLDLRMIAIVQDKNKKDIGCLIMIPNYNHMIKAAKGRINFALIKNYFNRIKLAGGEIRGYALGVLKEAHGQGIGSLLVDEMYEWGKKYGYDKCEVSWVLANNGPMNELSLAMNGKQSKTYRIYEKDPQDPKNAAR